MKPRSPHLPQKVSVHSINTFLSICNQEFPLGSAGRNLFSTEQNWRAIHNLLQSALPGAPAYITGGAEPQLSSSELCIQRRRVLWFVCHPSAIQMGQRRALAKPPASPAMGQLVVQAHRAGKKNVNSHPWGALLAHFLVELLGMQQL